MNRGTNKFIDVEKATVALQGKGGQGVLVNGNLILTAAHCVTFSLKGYMTMGEHYMEEIKTKDGALLQVCSWAVEPVSDIAVLGALDEQECSKEVEAFKEFCEQTKPVPIFKGILAVRESIKVYVYTHLGTWLHGKVTQFSTQNFHQVCLEAEEAIIGGTSGSPIVNEEGELVGIVSTSGEKPESPTRGYVGNTPRPLLALPTWICHQIESAKEGNPHSSP